MLESALAAVGTVGAVGAVGAAQAHGPGPLAVKGTYFEAGQEVTFRVVVREAKSGQTLAGAEASLPVAAIPKELPLRPQNFDQALRDQRLLAHGEEVSGKLRVEVWTNKGDRGLIFQEGEELKLHVRVNQPAWVQLSYLLANGMKAPLEQAWYIDASKVNRAVEYPATLEVAPPFGIEQVFAVASTDRPEPLRTHRKVVDGQPYDVVAEGVQGLVRHRGFRKKKPTLQLSEAHVSFTTTPRQAQ